MQSQSSLLLLPSQELDYRDYHTTQSYELLSQNNESVDCVDQTQLGEVSALMSVEEISIFLKSTEYLSNIAKFSKVHNYMTNYDRA